MITVKVEEHDVLNMLMDRVRYWTDDDDTINLFEIYYDECLQAGDFEGIELDIPAIVDNDYINWLDVIYEDDFKDYNIADKYDERIVAYYGGAYLIQAY